MPLSNRTFDEAVEEFLSKHLEKKYLDLGTGAGKYGKIIRKVNPEAYIIGVEVNPDYIEKYGVKKIYDELHQTKVQDFVREKLSLAVDVVTLGDLLEHLFKSDGLDLIHYLMYRCKYIVAVFPSKFVQIDIKGYPEEAHNSVWSEEDFAQFKHQYKRSGHMNLVIIQGFLSDPDVIVNHHK